MVVGLSCNYCAQSCTYILKGAIRISVRETKQSILAILVLDATICLVLTIYTNHPVGNLVHNHKIVILTRWGTTRYKVYSNKLNRLRRAEKLQLFKLQPIFSEVSQTE